MKTTRNPKGAFLALSLSIALTVGSQAASLAAMFQDTQYHWAQSDILQLSNENIIGGYPDGTFRPEGQITRAEFSAILVKALGLSPQATYQTSFRDVPAGFWASPAIETVRAQGLVSGYPGGMFMPQKNISRAESMAILAQAARLPMPDVLTTNQTLNNYSDQANVPTWARPAVAAAIQSGLYANDPSAGNRIEPTMPATRGEVAAMVGNLRETMNLANRPTGTTSQQQAYQQPQQPSYQPQQQVDSQGALQGRVTAVPANTRFTGTLQTPISTEINRVGDKVTMIVDQPLVATDGAVIVPAGSQITGQIAMIEQPGRTGKNAKMDIDFNEITTPDGRRFQITAQVDTENGLLEGGTTKGRVLKALGKTAVGAGLGAALGTAMGPLSGGEVGKGAIYGTAVGAGVGAAAAAIGKGEDVVVTTGDKLQVRLTQPLTVTAGAQTQPPTGY